MESVGAMEIIDLASQGLSPTKIAKQLGYKLSHVKKVLSKYMQSFSLELAEKAEHVRLHAQMRLDYIYERVAPYAFPSGDRATANEEDSDFVQGDAQLIGILLRVLKEEREWVKMERQIGTDDRNTQVNIENMEITMAASNPLYATALNSMQPTWMSGLSERDINEVYQPAPGDTEIEKIEGKIERRVEKIAQALDIDLLEEEG